MAQVQVKATDTQEMILSKPTAEINTLNITNDIIELKRLNDEFEAKRKVLYGLQFEECVTQQQSDDLNKRHCDTVEEMKRLQVKITELKKNGIFTTQAGVMAFEMTIVAILDFYGVGWSDGQIEEAAKELYQNYNWLQIAELKLFVSYVKHGNYNKEDYRKFAPFLLLQWVDDFAHNSIKIRSDMQVSKANDERYNERWGNIDNRKAENHKATSLMGEIQQIKSKLKQDAKGEVDKP